MFTNYIRNELGYKTDMFYYPSGGIQPWDYGVQNGFGDTTSLLRNAMAKNPYMKVMVAAGYFDLATPYYAVEYTFNHMGLQSRDAQEHHLELLPVGPHAVHRQRFARQAEARHRGVHFERAAEGRAVIRAGSGTIG